MNTEQLDLSVITLSWNTRDLLKECLRSVFETTQGMTLEVIVVDNSSSDGSPAMVRERFPKVHLLENRENVGFSGGNNQAIGVSEGRYVLLLNSDALAQPGAVHELLSFMEAHPRAGAAGARLLNADGTFQASHSPFPTLWQEFLILSRLGRAFYGPCHPSHGPDVEKGPQQADYVEGACMLVRREVIEQVGGLDEGFFMYAEEVDWCYRMKQTGWEVWYVPDARVVHYGGSSTRQRPGRMEAELYRSRIRFFRKHYGDAQAATLKALVYAFTLPKIIWHRSLRWLTRDRYGRRTPGLSELQTLLREV